MKILPVTNYSDRSFKGRVGNKTAELTKEMGKKWTNAATDGRYSTLPIINTCLYNAGRINDIFINLSTIMERFGHGCELNFAKSAKNEKYRFFIENKYSNYKVMCGDIELSEKLNKLHDVNELEMLEGKVAKLNPYAENTNFIIQRKSDAKDIIFDKEFEPDADYTFLEDKLIRKEMKEATMEDIEEFLDAAKEEGLIDG